MQIFMWTAHGLTVVAPHVEHARLLVRENLHPVATKMIGLSGADEAVRIVHEVPPDRVFPLATHPRARMEVIFSYNRDFGRIIVGR